MNLGQGRSIWGRARSGRHLGRNDTLSTTMLRRFLAQLGLSVAYATRYADVYTAPENDCYRLGRQSTMRKIDAFEHMLPRAYLERLVRQLEHPLAPSQLASYRAGVCSYDPVLTDLDARWRQLEFFGPHHVLIGT